MRKGTSWSRDENQVLLQARTGASREPYATLASKLNRQFHGGRRVRTVSSCTQQVWKQVKPVTKAAKAAKATKAVKATAPAADELTSTWHENDNNAEAVVYSRSIRTIEELNAYVCVDLTVWEVATFDANIWEMGAKDLNGVLNLKPLFQLKAKYRRIQPLVIQLAQLHKLILQDIQTVGAAQFQGLTAPIWVCGTTDIMAEFGLPDLHLNKSAWPDETGEAYDSDIAEVSFRNALDALIHKACLFNPERAIITMGNDFFHIDNRLNTTTAGTLQDADTRYFRMIRRGRLLYAWALQRIAAAIGPVTAVSVPGNHDKISATFLAELLAAQFETHPLITVDQGLFPRKYVRHGTVLLGFAHGNEERPTDLPLLMAQEQPHHWAQSTHREWHLGHLHKMKETRYTSGDSFQGVRVRILPSLSRADSWHATKGYTGEPHAAEVYLWSAGSGYVGHLNHTSRSTREIECMQS